MGYAHRPANRSSTEFGATANKQYRQDRNRSLLVQLTERLEPTVDPTIQHANHPLVVEGPTIRL
jgi:hypothetical protein